MCSEDAGVALDEPFDCLSAVSDAILARSDELNCVLPSRINVAFGGSPRCREDALMALRVSAGPGEPRLLERLVGRPAPPPTL